MVEINLINKENFNEIEYTKLKWDVVMNGIPYQVIRVPGHVHTIGGKLDWGEGNNLWAYPLNEELSPNNILEFDGHPGARWGFRYEPTNYYKNKWDEPSIEAGRRLIITRNDEVFYDEFMTMHEMMAYVLDGMLNDHPLNLNERDYDKNCIGRKVWYRSQPALIASFTKGRACVTLVPDGQPFKCPPEYSDDTYCYEDGEVFTSIFDKHIYWFRD